MARVVATGVLAALLVVPSASAKGIGHMVVVGANGSVVHVAGGDRLMRAGTASRVPTSGYLLVYPLLRSGLPAGTGRYFPAARVACFTAFRVSRDLPCYQASRFLRTQLGRGARLPRFTGAPTTIVRLLRNGVAQGLNPIARPAFELAFASWAYAREAAAPDACPLSYTATWKGPDAAVLPKTFCLAPGGVFANGRLYPVSAAAYAKLAAP